MHIPDVMMDAKTAVTTVALSAAGLALALRQARLHLPPRRVPLMGLAGAFVFAAQMLNFPVAAGTSGHLIGAVLCAILLGPSAAVVVLTAVLIVQCLMFSDGGVTALGANVFNMAVVGTLGGYAVYYLVSRSFKGLRGQVMAAAFAGWCSTVLAAMACAGELAMAGTLPWSKAFPAMAGIHMLIGLGEGLITALALVAIARTRPELLPETDPTPPPFRYGVAAVYGALISLGMAILLSPLASPAPDGLEHVADKLDFAEKPGDRPVLAAPIPDYKMPGVRSRTLATSLAGAAGTAVAFVLALILSRALVPRSQAIHTPAPSK